MRPILALVLLSFVAACGAAGAPKPPAGTKPGVSISGTASFGVAGKI